MRNLIAGILISMAVLASIGPVLAQVSPNFDLGWHRLSGGGGTRESTHYQIDDVIGQWADGSSVSDHYRIDPGFWHVGQAAETQRIYLPLVQSADAD